MKILQKLSKKIIAKIFIVTGILIFVKIGLLLISEQKNIAIDRYNFEQLEKARVILDKIPKDDEKFFTLEYFNAIYIMLI